MGGPFLVIWYFVCEYKYWAFSFGHSRHARLNAQYLCWYTKYQMTKKGPPICVRYLQHGPRFVYAIYNMYGIYNMKMALFRTLFTTILHFSLRLHSLVCNICKFFKPQKHLFYTILYTVFVKYCTQKLYTYSKKNSHQCIICIQCTMLNAKVKCPAKYIRLV